MILVSKVYQLIVTICEASTHHLGFNIGNEKSLKIILENQFLTEPFRAFKNGLFVKKNKNKGDQK
jgi:hypothetical protein